MKNNATGTGPYAVQIWFCDEWLNLGGYTDLDADEAVAVKAWAESNGDVARVVRTGATEGK